MVQIIEFRIPLPISVEEYHIAQLYMVASESLSNTGNGEGVTVLKNEPFEDPNRKGQYTHKLFNFAKNLPSWMTMLVPSDALKLEEFAWNCYPNCETKYWSPFLKERLNVVITSLHIGDKGDSENVFNFDQNQLKKRRVIVLNIADNSMMDLGKYTKETDPTLVKSEKTDILPLNVDFMQTSPVMMCCYKYYLIDFNFFGGSLVEGKAISFTQNLLVDSHRKLMCLIDKWKGMTIQELRSFEDQVAKELQERIKADKSPNNS